MAVPQQAHDPLEEYHLYTVYLFIYFSHGHEFIKDFSFKSPKSSHQKNRKFFMISLFVI